MNKYQLQMWIDRIHYRVFWIHFNREVWRPFWKKSIHSVVRFLIQLPFVLSVLMLRWYLLLKTWVLVFETNIILPIAFLMSLSDYAKNLSIETYEWYHFITDNQKVNDWIQCKYHKLWGWLR